MGNRWLRNKLLLNMRINIIRCVTIFIMISLLMASLLSATPVMAQSVILSSYSAPPGSSITVSGSGFIDGDTYQITFAPGTYWEQVLISTTVISGTSFSRVVTIPSAPWGDYTIRISSNRGNFSPTFRVNPKIELYTTSGYVGETITITGMGFRANTSVNVIFNNSNIVNTASNSYGNLDVLTFQVPALPGGNYQIYASDGIASSSGVTFNIRPRLTLDYNEGSVGDQISLEGTGFDDNSNITIYWDNEVLSQNDIFSNSSGSFSADVVVPSSSRGSHTIKARDAIYGTDTASFTVRPSIILDSDSGVPGQVVHISGRGFRTNASVDITYSGTHITTAPANIYTDNDGSFSASFIVPSVVSGNYAVRADDGLYSATATFRVTSNIDLIPSSGSVGDELIVNGTGFTPGGRVTISYDNQAVITVTTDSSGSFSVSFSVPVSNAGEHNVSAKDVTAQGVAATAVFSMESNPPLKPNLLMPGYDSRVNVQTRFIWSEVSDPSGVTYNLQVAWDADFSRLVFSKQGLNISEYQVAQGEELELTKKANPYYWRVRAVDRAGNESGWTSPGSFYTQDSTSPDVPIAFTPEYEAQTNVQPRFDWSDVTDQSGVTYEIQVARDANFSHLLLSKQGLTVSEYQVTQTERLGLTKKDNPYYWRVRAVDGAKNASEWTVAGSFYTQDSTPPDTPVPLSPEHGSQQDRETIFDWTDVSDPSGITYRLQVAQDPDFSYILVYKESIQKSEYQLAEMEKLRPTSGDPPSPYYWRIKAIDGVANESNWSNSNAFYVSEVIPRWVMYVLIVIGGILLLGIGILIGMRMRPRNR